MSDSPTHEDNRWSPPHSQRDVNMIDTQGVPTDDLAPDRQPAYDSNITHVTDTQIEPDVSLEQEHLGDNSQTDAIDTFVETTRPPFVPTYLQRPPSSGDAIGSFKYTPATKQTLDLIGNRRFPSQQPQASSQETTPPSGQRTTNPLQQNVPRAQDPPPSYVQLAPKRTSQSVDNPDNQQASMGSQPTITPSEVSQGNNMGTSKARRTNRQPKAKKSKGSKKSKKPATAANNGPEDPASLSRQTRPALEPSTPTFSSAKRFGDILPPIPGLEETTSDGPPCHEHISDQAAASRSLEMSHSSTSLVNGHAPPGGVARPETRQPEYIYQQGPLAPDHGIEDSRDRRPRIDSELPGYEPPQRIPEAPVRTPLPGRSPPKVIANPPPSFDGPKVWDETPRGSTTKEAIVIDDEDAIHPIIATAKAQRAKNPLQERRVNELNDRTDFQPKAHHEHAKVEKPKRKPSKIRTAPNAPGGQLLGPQSKSVHSDEKQRPPGVRPITGNGDQHLPQGVRSAVISTTTNKPREPEANGPPTSGRETSGYPHLIGAQPGIPNPASSTDDLIQALLDRTKVEKAKLLAIAAAEREHQAQNASLSREKAQLSEKVEKLSAANAQCQERLRKFSAAMQGPDSKLAKHQNYLTGLGNDMDLLRSEHTAFLDKHRAVQNDRMLLKEGLDEVAASASVMRDRVKELRDPGGPLSEARIELARLDNYAQSLARQLEEKTGMLVTERDRNAGLERKLEQNAANHQELKDLLAGHRRSIMEKLMELHTVVDLAQAREEDEANSSKLDDCLRFIKGMRDAEKVTPADIENINSMINALSQGVFLRFDESDETLDQTLTASRDIVVQLKNELTAIKSDLQSQHELDKQIAQLREKNARLEEGVSSGENALDDARLQLKGLQSEKSDLQQRTTNLQLEIITLKAQPLDSSQTVQRLRDLEDRNTELHNCLTASQIELAKAEAKVKALDEDVNRLRPELADLKTRFEDSQATTASFDRQKYDLEKQAEQRITDAKDQFEKDANNKVQQQQLDFDNRVHQLAQLRQAAEERSVAANNRAELREESEKLALGNLSQLRRSEASLTIKGADLEKRNATLEDRVKALEDELESREVDIQNHQESQASTDDELRQVRQSLATAYNEGKKDKATIVTLRTEMEGLRTQLASTAITRSPEKLVEARPRRKANRNGGPKATTSPVSSNAISKAEASTQKTTPRVTFRTDPIVEKLESEPWVPLPVEEPDTQPDQPETPSFARFEKRFQVTSPLTPLEEVDMVVLPSPNPEMARMPTAGAMPHPASKALQTPADSGRTKKNSKYDFSDESPVDENTAAMAKRERQAIAAMCAYSPKTLRTTTLGVVDSDSGDVASRYVPNVRDIFKPQPSTNSHNATSAGVGQAKSAPPSKAPLPSALKRKRTPADAKPEGSKTFAGRASKRPTRDAVVPEIPDSQPERQNGSGLFQQSSQASISSQSRAKAGQSEQAPPKRPMTKLRRRRTYGTEQRYNLREERFNKELDK
ncbi:MAG: hypothetical protein M1812_006463 [Candelaria pacifica]|nr:MAG: hypothetical protein M1812_006463 [Candelaria pacifica]